jgi:di/tricarboxylate transporter
MYGGSLRTSTFVGLDALLVAALAIGSLVMCITGWVTLDVAGIAIIAVLVTTRILDMESALAGFASQPLITLASLYVIGEALTRTGALESVAALALRASKGNPLRLMLVLCLTAAGISAFVSDTAVVLVFMPLSISLSATLGIPPSRLLLPIAYSALMGGTVTTVGSTTNLLASAAAERAGTEPFGFFEMTPIALPYALCGVIAMALLARRLLPDRTSLTGLLAQSSPREYVSELTVDPGSSLIGSKLTDAFGTGTRVLFVTRGEEMLTPPLDAIELAAGDVVMLQGHVGQLADLVGKLGIRPAGGTRVDPRTMTYFELAVTPRSRIVGQRIAELQLARDYDAYLVAVLRDGRHVRERASQLELRPGDLLLVCGDEHSQARLRASSEFFLLTGAQQWVLRRHLAGRALLIAGAIVALFVLGSTVGIGRWLPLPLVALLGAVGMVASGCVTPRYAYRAIDWTILLFVVGALALGQAMEKTGLARFCAEAVIDTLASHGPVAVASGMLAVGTVLNQFTSPYAVAVLLTPIAVATANQLQVDPRPFVLAIAFAGSNAFATPMGHQVNLMVMGPGGYRFTDYLRLGLPMCLFTWAFVTGGLALMMQSRA